MHGVVAGIVQISVLEAEFVEHGAERARDVGLLPRLVEHLRVHGADALRLVIEIEANVGQVGDVLVDVMAGDNNLSLLLDERLQDGPDGLACFAAWLKCALPRVRC